VELNGVKVKENIDIDSVIGKWLTELGGGSSFTTIICLKSLVMAFL
jgi:hypothetical protein